MNHYVLEILAKDRQNEMWKTAEECRLLINAKKHQHREVRQFKGLISKRMWEGVKGVRRTMTLVIHRFDSANPVDRNVRRQQKKVHQR